METKAKHLDPVLALLREFDASVKIAHSGRGKPRWDEQGKDEHDSYAVTIQRGKQSYTFEFWASIQDSNITKWFGSTQTRVASKKPDEYDVLSCLQWTRYWCGHSDWCCNFGYEPDSRHGLEVFLAVEDQLAGVSRLFSEAERARLQEVCC